MHFAVNALAGPARNHQHADLGGPRGHIFTLIRVLLESCRTTAKCSLSFHPNMLQGLAKKCSFQLVPAAQVRMSVEKEQGPVIVHAPQPTKYAVKLLMCHCPLWQKCYTALTLVQLPFASDMQIISECSTCNTRLQRRGGGGGLCATNLWLHSCKAHRLLSCSSNALHMH